MARQWAWFAAHLTDRIIDEFPDGRGERALDRELCGRACVVMGEKPESRSVVRRQLPAYCGHQPTCRRLRPGWATCLARLRRSFEIRKPTRRPE
jgi:hypothetical protein